ncbi:histidine kinase [Asaia sp. W19]|uniref:GAF domain-containing protein n=1 Tax=unclassified Asaia TaxID=2685023 RepID=UPI000F8E274F|nr:GAF domain-containing protein [Asaia sp. W19]RUT24483.1 histidine kinase [Asaia sp. W19]
MVDERTSAVGLAAYDILDTPPERGFDDLVSLAAQLCDVPIAVISLLDHDRQWFKARTGILLEGTSREEAFCRLVVESDKAVEITDLALDPRTASNPLVTGEPCLRFYAGTPLRTPYGTLGALAVADNQPRGAGLGQARRAALDKLAKLAVDLLEKTRRTQALLAAQTRWRGLFQGMEEGFFLARVVRDHAGQVRDWEYHEVNPAWEHHVGIRAIDVIGKRYGELFHQTEADWLGLASRAVADNKAVPFLQRVQVTGRWYCGNFHPVGQDFFSATFREVTGQISAERRQTGLVRLGDVLRDERDVAIMTSRAMEVIGEALCADRATYGELDHDIETINVAEGWSVAGMPPIKGIYRFDDYGHLRETLLAGRALVIADVMADPRTRAESAGWLALKARGVINVPVREDGRNVALMLVHFSLPHDWTSDEIHWLHNAADRLELAIARRRAEELQNVINGEIAHRLRNTLAMVQAVARMTLRDALSKEEANRFYARLQSLGRAHDLLHCDDQRAAILGELIASIVGDAGMGERCRLSGPVIRLGSRAAMSTALLIHEMTTNACKHGALSAGDGTVEIVWEVETTETGNELVLLWRERNGPPASPPLRGGFGSRLISFGLIGTGGVSLHYGPEGLSASFRADAEKIKRT